MTSPLQHLTLLRLAPVLEFPQLRGQLPSLNTPPPLHLDVNFANSSFANGQLI